MLVYLHTKYYIFMVPCSLNTYITAECCYSIIYLSSIYIYLSIYQSPKHQHQRFGTFNFTIFVYFELNSLGLGPDYIYIIPEIIID